MLYQLSYEGTAEAANYMDAVFARQVLPANSPGKR